MEIYISDVRSDGSHPQSCGDNLEDRLCNMFPDKPYQCFRDLTGILNVLLDEIEIQRRK